ncbi:MAG TPA: hypothetical protein VJS69_09420 [Candidatus Krumholzibacteria bacterium]|nr:hypothetical protein [Candidatus Krumholzibacteria bacterium]
MAMIRLSAEERRIAFGPAVKLAGYGSIDRWAHTNRVSPSSCYQVLKGMSLERVELVMDAVINETLGPYAISTLRRRIASEIEHVRESESA